MNTIQEADRSRSNPTAYRTCRGPRVLPLRATRMLSASPSRPIRTSEKMALPRRPTHLFLKGMKMLLKGAGGKISTRTSEANRVSVIPTVPVVVGPYECMNVSLRERESLQKERDGAGR